MSKKSKCLPTISMEQREALNKASTVERHMRVDGRAAILGSDTWKKWDEMHQLYHLKYKSARGGIKLTEGLDYSRILAK